MYRSWGGSGARPRGPRAPFPPRTGNASGTDDSQIRRDHDSARANWRSNNRGNFRNYSSQRRDFDTYALSSFNALESILKKDPEALILDLLNDNRGFFDYLQQSPQIPNNTLVVAIQILKKVCDSAFDDLKHKVLQQALTPSFVDKIKIFIALLPMQSLADKERNSYFWGDPDRFWNDILAICDTVQKSTPTFALTHLPPILNALLVSVPSFEAQHNSQLGDEFKNRLNQMHDILKDVQKNHEKIPEIVHKNTAIDLEPPNDFREIDVYPTAAEILGERDFLRPNIVKGPYKDVNHYLDVQFRLLREDFVGPLRKGIATYRAPSIEKKRLENVKIHKRVRFIKCETINSLHCVRLRFDFNDNPSRRKFDFKYEDSRKFMFGSLLCFTNDNFNTIIFGKVAARDEKDLEKGELIVGFQSPPQIWLKTDYMMVECSVYFEPYFHVLNVLKKLNPNDFPMEKYIIKVDSSAKPPNYLLQRPYIEIGDHEFQPLVRWPEETFYNFNDSQLNAFKAGLTQEFAVIQGPPGTGKTFLGLKIAKTLLDNMDSWRKQTPMLVICYTNHALDQFLEGLLPYTQEIIRVGGQSKNENLQRFNLRENRKPMNPAVYDMKNKVQSYFREIAQVTSNLEQIDSYDTICDFEAFHGIVPNYDRSWFYTASDEEILKWLMGGKPKVRLNTDDNYDFLSTVGKKAEVEEEFENNNDGDVDKNTEEVDPLFDDVFDITIVRCSSSLIKLANYREIIAEENRNLNKFRNMVDPTLSDYTLAEASAMKLEDAYVSLNYLQHHLNRGRGRNFHEPSYRDMVHANSLNFDDRWSMYFYFLDLHRRALCEKLHVLNEKFREVHNIYEEMRQAEDTDAMKNAHVVGITTTGAARLRSSLQALKSPVVIVEEAAEVLEAHIVTSISKHCQHLILIGDHQQLKPSTTDYDVERKFKLGISLFERMVMNKVQCHTLDIQHRMRPEIAALIAPAIYPNLKNDFSVTDRPKIQGLDNCVFFIDHQYKEDDCSGTSKKNNHEAAFLIGLARHLILNGHKPSQITILAAYWGQMFELRRQKTFIKPILDGVRIAVLDNYQGEECDIILLSTVRNNDENKIGFLSIENRVCVALSRARNGFYLMGNMTQLCSRSELWGKIRDTLKSQNSLGQQLPLRCQIHVEEVTHVATAGDFYMISEGGCSKKCGVHLACGHKCSSICHITDREHTLYKCPETCNRPLCEKNDAHICKQPCYRPCATLCDHTVTNTLPCGHVVDMLCHFDPEDFKCPVLVKATLPCGHEANKPCHQDPEKTPCPSPCDVQVEPCGHSCILNCHIRNDPDHLEYKCRKNCTKNMEGCSAPEEEAHPCKKLCFEVCDMCSIQVQKARTKCSHKFTVACHSDVDLLTCLKPCTKTLPCGHRCKLSCCDPCDSSPCQRQVKKTLTCGHTLQLKCFQEPHRGLCGGKCPLQLKCGHPCTKTCKETCTEKCDVKVQCLIRAKCGHDVTEIPCHLKTTTKPDQDELLKYCTSPCGSELRCKHTCQGTCGSCLQGRIHQRCTEQCGIPLVCNHLCSFPCRSACRPCSKPCEFRCRHSKCKRKCGEACTPCKEACPRRCAHVRCTKFCGDVCNVDPCTQACRMKLKCGHMCIGFCGDPCPPKCLTCDGEELLTIFFGTEAEDSRFVLLEDCGHVLESQGLEEWLAKDPTSIGFKTCPMCKTLIKKTGRFKHLVKKSMQDVAKVKVALHGKPEVNDAKRRALERKVNSIITERKLQKVDRTRRGLILTPARTIMQSVYRCSNDWKSFETYLTARLQVNRRGKRQPIDQHEINALTSKIQIVEHVFKIFLKVDVKGPEEIFRPQLDLIASVLLRDENYITNQEIDDLKPELNRLTRIVELSNIEKTPQYQNLKHTPAVSDLRQKLEAVVFGHSKFSQATDDTVKALLKELSDSVAGSIGISESEKIEILGAMGFKKGHWFKCPNGHVYAIGECGGAMEESKCNECGSAIGGQRHALRSDNQVATEMDGARQGAWSTRTDLANYNIDFDEDF